MTRRWSHKRYSQESHSGYTHAKVVTVIYLNHFSDGYDSGCNAIG